MRLLVSQSLAELSCSCGETLEAVAPYRERFVQLGNRWCHCWVGCDDSLAVLSEGVLVSDGGVAWPEADMRFLEHFFLCFSCEVVIGSAVRADADLKPENRDIDDRDFNLLKITCDKIAPRGRSTKRWERQAAPEFKRWELR